MDLKEHAINLTIESSKLLQDIQSNNTKGLVNTLDKMLETIALMKSQLVVNENEVEIELPRVRLQNPGELKGVIYRQTSTGNVDMIIPTTTDDERLMYVVYKNHEKEVDLIIGDTMDIHVLSNQSFHLMIDKENTKKFKDSISLEVFMDQFDCFDADEKIIAFLNSKQISYIKE